MEQILLNLAEASPVALVAVYSIWRISIVMLKLADALVQVSQSNANNVTELVDKKAGDY